MSRLRLIFVAFALWVGALTAAGQEVTYTDSLAFRLSPQELADSLIAYAKTFMGTPYLLGATGPDRYDCSSFVRKAYSGIGLDIPRYTWTQIKVGKAVDDTLCHQCVALLSVLAGGAVPVSFQTDAGGLELL